MDISAPAPAVRHGLIVNIITLHLPSVNFDSLEIAPQFARTVKKEDPSAQRQSRGPTKNARPLQSEGGRLSNMAKNFTQGRRPAGQRPFISSYQWPLSVRIQVVRLPT